MYLVILRQQTETWKHGDITSNDLLHSSHRHPQGYNMNYINFVVITDTPGRLRDFLIARNIIKEVDDGQGGQTLVGVNPGMEWVRVPNPIRIDEADSPITAPDHDDRNVYLVKFAHESVESQVETSDDSPSDDSPGSSDLSGDIYDWSRFGRWVKNNGDWQNAPAGWTINGEHAGRAWKITGENVWLIRENPERFGVWQ
jgi:hypothetical protein